MTRRELERLGIQLFGWGWQSTLARGLGVDDRTVRRWGVEVETPEYVEAVLESLSLLRALRQQLPSRWSPTAERRRKMNALRALCRRAFSEYRVRGLDNVAEPRSLGKREALIIAEALETQGNISAFKLGRQIRAQAAQC